MHMYDSKRRLVLPATGTMTILYGIAVLASFPPLVGALVLLVPLAFVAVGIISMAVVKIKKQILAAVYLAAIMLYGYTFLYYFSAPLGTLAWLAQLPVMLAYFAMASLAGKLPKSNP